MLYMLKEAGKKKKKKSDGPVQHKSEFKRTNQFLSKCIWAEGKSNMMHPACIAVRQTEDTVVWLFGRSFTLPVQSRAAPSEIR